MPAPQIILDLIERFERNLDAYKAGSYNETQARHEFIDPFFEALGWDVNNKAGNAEAYKDVIHEDAVKVSGVTKAPDYSFRIGGQRKFFVEAKKPSVNIKDAPAAAFQVRRYAWSAKLPLSIVTDFDELAVYDCRIKPDQKDSADKARIKYYTYRQYAEKWDEIAAIFSKDAILKGSFDKYAESNKAKRGTAEVDSAFLAEIESWRDMLARNIALRNTLTVRELNDSVQRIIDRIIFLRIAEDRGIEDYGSLRGICNGNNTYGRLQELFYKADDRYNSGLFHFRHEKGETEPPDRLTPDLQIDDKPLKDILKTLYYPDSPYEFAVLPADILGQVYEQFLGKVIRLSSDHRAVVEDKPEVKKAGGVFYTPTYIVEYIVKNTVGKLLDGKTPKKAESLRILDPACGSGSFLLGAYQNLLDWHLKWYTENNPEKHNRDKKPALYSGHGGVWYLTTAERKRILLNNIYGVDIDSQAVEVTKLSLLLKVLEGETGETLNQQRKLFHERALPNLGGNIKCGNSLIGPDFYDGKQMNLLDSEETQRVNVFDWQAEFPEIFKAGGFDAVIGNPPWGAEFKQEEKEYFRVHYEDFHVRTPESFNYFIGKMWKLTRLGGYVGVITPSSFLNQHEFWKTRKVLVETAKLFRICNLGDGVFKKVTAPSCILVFGTNDKQNLSLFFDFRKNERISLPLLLEQEYEGQDASSVGKDSESYILQVRNDGNIIQKCYRWPALREVAEDVATGVSSGLDSAFIYKEKEVGKLGLEKYILRKLITGGEINRYSLNPESQKMIIYATREIDIKDYPNCYEALEKYRDRLKNRVETKSGLIPWYSLYRPRRKKLFELPKILIRQTADRILACYDADGWYCLKSGIIVQIPKNAEIHYNYLVGLLNSRLIRYLYDDLVGEQARVFPEVKPVQLFKLPIRTIDIAKSNDKKMHDRMVQLVEQMLALHKQLPEAKTSHDQTLIQRQIDATDRQIDKLVYELYGLTEEEIAIVEGS